MSYGFYLYGIFPLPVPQGIQSQGLDRQPVLAHVHDGFVFLYSEAQQERYLASRRNLLDHEKVLEQSMQAGHRVLLPLQFGLIVEDWQTVTEQLTQPHSDKLNGLFDKLSGRREVSIKVFWDAAAELQALMQENEDLQRERDQLEGKTLSMDQVVRIGQSIEQSMAGRQKDITDTFRAVLEPLAVEVLENPPLTEAMIYNTAYLISWEEEPVFSDRVEALDQQFEGRLRIRYNNFTAPYSFAQLNP